LGFETNKGFMLFLDKNFLTKEVQTRFKEGNGYRYLNNNTYYVGYQNDDTGRVEVTNTINFNVGYHFNRKYALSIGIGTGKAKQLDYPNPFKNSVLFYNVDLFYFLNENFMFNLGVNIGSVTEKNKPYDRVDIKSCGGGTCWTKDVKDDSGGNSTAINAALVFKF
jgi:hypothetical protein